MKFQHPHALGKEEARRRVERLTEYWRTRHGVSVTWAGDAAQLNGAVKGIKFDARLTIGDKVIDAEGTDPGILVRAAALAYFKRKLADFLDPGKTDADLARLT